ncbi:MlaD family protein [bacterium]|nr:MlaD family protein [bacterium]
MAVKKISGLELKVGITAGIALLFLALTIFMVEKIHFGQAGYPIYVSFQFVDAINPQADVVIGGGVKIGYVSQITAKGERIILAVMLNKNVKVPKSAKFQIISKGLMGDKYLNVVAQKDVGEYLQANDRVVGVEPLNIDKAFERFGQVADSIKLMLGDPDIQGSLGDMMRNFESLSGRLDQLVRENEQYLSNSFENFSQAAESINEFSKDIESITHGLEKVLSKTNQKNIETTLVSLKNVSVRLDEQILNIEKSKGALGVLINDEKMAKDLKQLVKELKDDPWKLLWKQ